MENIIKAGKNTILAHLEHLKKHEEYEYLQEALEFIQEKEIDVKFDEKPSQSHQVTPHVCPSMKTQSFSESSYSHIPHWPIQRHLLSPHAPFFQNSDVLLVADCVAYPPEISMKNNT